MLFIKGLYSMTSFPTMCTNILIIISKPKKNPS